MMRERAVVYSSTPSRQPAMGLTNHDLSQLDLSSVPFDPGGDGTTSSGQTNEEDENPTRGPENGAGNLGTD